MNPARTDAAAGRGSTPAAVLALAGIAALAVGVLVYLVDRPPSHAALIPGVAALAHRHGFGPIGPWLPSFVHPFAFALLTAALLPALSRSRYAACAIWGVVDIAFEAGQHPWLRDRVAHALLDSVGTLPAARMVANFFVRGTFDGGDVVAVLLGTAAAATAVRLACAAEENRHA